jgi:hypothetical protein
MMSPSHAAQAARLAGQRNTGTLEDHQRNPGVSVQTERRPNWPQGLFDSSSPVCHAALEDLSVVLDQLGFKVRKKSLQEATLRVYVAKHNQYPLLNPRFETSAVYRGKRQAGGFLVFSVLSKGDEVLDNRLRTFNSNHEGEFTATSHDSAGYHYHGEFVIPLARTGPSNESIDYGALLEPLLEIARACKG